MGVRWRDMAVKTHGCPSESRNNYVNNFSSTIPASIVKTENLSIGCMILELFTVHLSNQNMIK